jgi:hypothetical protein
LFPYIIELRARIPAVADRWGYLLRTLEAVRPLDEPIPQIAFGPADNKVLTLLHEWSRVVGRDCGGLSDFRVLLEWLCWVLALSEKQPRLGDEVSEKLYRKVDLTPLLERPHDYQGEYVATSKERDFEFSRDSSFHGGSSPDGKWFVSGVSSRQPLGVFAAATGREVYRLGCGAFVSAVSPDSKRLAVSSTRPAKRGETVIRIFELASGMLAAEFPLGVENWYFSLAFSPDGKTLACGSSDRSCLLDVATGRVLHRLPGSPVGVNYSPDGKTLIASIGHRLRFWDVATGAERHDWPGEFGHNPALAVSPDGRILAAGDWMEREVSLWDTAGGRLLRRLPLMGEGRYVRDLAFSADGADRGRLPGHGVPSVLGRGQRQGAARRPAPRPGPAEGRLGLLLPPVGLARR